MTQPNVPDRSQEPTHDPDPATSPVDHAPAQHPDAGPRPVNRPRPTGPPADSGAGRGHAAGPPRGPARPAAPTPPTVAARRSVAGRLMLVLPIAAGVLVVEGVFAAGGQRGDIVSLPAAGLALVLLWGGVAWALRGWVVLLMTFVPAIMITLGAAMIGSAAPGPGAALMLVGLALIGAVASFRLSAPARRWSPGWLVGPRGAGASWPATAPTAGSAITGPAGGRQALAGPTVPDEPAVPDEPDAWRQTGVDGRSAGFPFRPLDPLGAHFLHPVTPPAHGTGQTPTDPSPEQRPAPDWDTSGTDVAARDRFVALLCQRGGAAGPTLATLEEFFTGNGDPRSIAPGLRGAVPLAAFRSVLRRLRDHRGVPEVLVQVEPLEAGQYPAGEWPVAGSVHVIATLEADEIDALVAELRPEPCIGPLPVTALSTGGAAPSGSGEFAIWWA